MYREPPLGGDGIGYRAVGEARFDVVTLEVLLPALWYRARIVSVMIEHLFDKPVIGSKIGFKSISHAYLV